MKTTHTTYTKDRYGSDVRNDHRTEVIDGYAVAWVRLTWNNGYYSKHTGHYEILSITRADGSIIDCSNWPRLSAPHFGAGLAAGGLKPEMVEQARGIIEYDKMTPEARAKMEADFNNFSLF